jgi:hypothetical protein
MRSSHLAPEYVSSRRPRIDAALVPLVPPLGERGGNKRSRWSFSHRFVEKGWARSVEADGPNSPTTVDIVNRNRSVTLERIWPR